jgi:hypothetical protein
MPMLEDAEPKPDTGLRLQRTRSDGQAFKPERSMYFAAVIKKPSAFLPVAMSLTALAIVFVHIVTSGVARQADEGSAAHLWQLLMAAQIPIVAFFGIRWLPQSPRTALPVLALQAVAALAALAPVYLLNW